MRTNNQRRKNVLSIKGVVKMAQVILEGVYMACNPKTTSYEGKEKTSLNIDIYQPDSEHNEKTVQVKTEDLSLLAKLNNDYSMGSLFKCKAVVNAYKNKAYYRLVEVLN